MRYICDHQPPQELIDWVAQQRRAGVNLHFNTLGRVVIDGVEMDVKAAILRSRLLDQGFICAYTMVRIEENNCHLEHLEPRTVSDAEGRPEKTVKYSNMVACYPLEGKCEFGAHARESRELPFTPLNANCESRIRYEWNGMAQAATDGDREAQSLIYDDGNLLRLNHSTLVKWRKNAILGAGLSSESTQQKRLSDAERFAREILSFRRGDKLEPYCIALSHAAEAHVARLKKLAIKRRFAKGSSN